MKTNEGTFFSFSPLWRRLLTWLLLSAAFVLIIFWVLPLFKIYASFSIVGVGLLFVVQMSLNSAILLVCSRQPRLMTDSAPAKMSSSQKSVLLYLLLWLLFILVSIVVGVYLAVLLHRAPDGFESVLVMYILAIWLALSLVVGILGLWALRIHNKQRG